MSWSLDNPTVRLILTVCSRPRMLLLLRLQDSPRLLQWMCQYRWLLCPFRLLPSQFRLLPFQFLSLRFLLMHQSKFRCQ